MGKPVVAIVGRPNVGKSALFNRIVGRRLAIVEGEPGVTRDRLYAESQWLNRPFTIIDTGGIDFDDTDDIAVQVRRQAELAIDEADVILFVVDVRDGITAVDEEIANLLRRTNKPVILVVNKVDHSELETAVFEFYQLGLGDPIGVAAEHNRNIGDLLDRMCAYFPPAGGGEEDEDAVRVAVIGRPNVGKSSLVNALSGTERSIVTDIPGTTRDAVDTSFEWNGQRFVIVDTAGMRRRKRITWNIERYSVLRALRAVDRCSVALAVIDAVDGVTEQDKKIVGYAHEQGKGLILVVNKWDLVKKDSNTMARYEEDIRRELSFATYAPIVFVSALTRQRLPELLETTKYVADQHSLRITTGRLNEVLQEALYLNQPPSDKGRQLKIFYISQLGVKPPEFALFVNEPELLHFSYQRYLENKLREAFGFQGTPIWFKVRKRS
ncbi:MAG TPA: ribosome biogenesis GTPase Der [Firmicutes bacterium]|nr:ribosome biogenesis GTPase Der [Bacillota bacterium]